MKIKFSNFFTLTLLMLITTAGAGGAFVMMRNPPPKPPKLGHYTAFVYDRLAERIASEIVVPREENLLSLPPISGDGEDALRYRLLRALNRRGGVFLTGRGRLGGWAGGGLSKRNCAYV